MVKVCKNNMRWELLQDAKLFGVMVPKGFVTDGVSIPKFLWWFLHPAGLAFEAAIVHDYRHIQEVSMTRKFADKEFYFNMRQSGIGKFRVYIAWLSVRGYAIFKGIK